MPVKLNYENEWAGAVLIGSGTVTGDELCRCNDRMYDPDQIHKLRYQLCDFRQITNFEVSSDDVRRIANQDNVAATQNPDITMAIVANRRIVYGMARMWQAYTDEASFNSHVFRTMVEARAWLGENAGRTPRKRGRGKGVEPKYRE